MIEKKNSRQSWPKIKGLIKTFMKFLDDILNKKQFKEVTSLVL